MWEQFAIQQHQRDCGRRGRRGRLRCNNQQSVTFIGTFPPCPDMASTTPVAPGHGYDDCLTFLVPGGITKVSYNGTTRYIDSPVTWSPS